MTSENNSESPNAESNENLEPETTLAGLWEVPLEAFADDSGLALIMAQRFQALKEVLTVDQPNSVSEVVTSLDEAISNLYPYSEAHAGGMLFFRMEVEGRLLPSFDLAYLADKAEQKYLKGEPGVPHDEPPNFETNNTDEIKDDSAEAYRRDCDQIDDLIAKGAVWDMNCEPEEHQPLLVKLLDIIANSRKADSLALHARNKAFQHSTALVDAACDRLTE